jgi:predicted nuclease with TOPRIM domain
MAIGVPKTVYGELKLSEQLSFQLNELKQRFDNLREQLEYTSYQKDCLQRELATLSKKHSERGDQLKTVKKEMSQMKSTLSESIHKCFQLISNGNSLSSLTSKSEELRKDFAE